MKILITGDTGFIGSNTFKHLTLKGHDVYGCSRKNMSGEKSLTLYSGWSGDALHYSPSHKHYGLNLCDSVAVLTMLNHCQPECIIHTAANPIVKVDANNPAQIIDDNIKSTHVLCHHAKNCKFVFTSSLIVYGGLQCHTEGEQCFPESIYGATKLASESIIGCNKSLQSTIFRLGAIVGPGLTHGIIFDFIRKLKSDSPTLDMLGDKPGSSKSFLHISDFLSALELVIERGSDKFAIVQGIYNLCNESLVSVETLADIVKKTMNINKPTMWLGEGANWKGDNKILAGSIRELKDSGWTPKLTSGQAIERAVEENL